VEIAQWLLRGALAAVFVAMGVAHFLPRPARTMAAMIPPVLTTRISSRTLVRFTGLCEIAGGVGLLLPATRVAAAVCLTAFLIAVFPANARAAAHPERFGSAAIPFWPRLVGQLVLIALVLVAGLS
jgi:uncharacterized membrane protein